MKSINDLEPIINHHLFAVLKKEKFQDLRPSQIKAIDAGLFENKNLLVCTPTGSGKTLTAFTTVLSELITLSEKNKLELNNQK